VEDDLGVTHRARDGLVVADVADLELQDALVVAVRRVLGRHARPVPLGAHLVLLRLVAREDDDLLRSSDLA
jgi:hypothetical protein